MNDPIQHALGYIEAHLTDEIGFVDVARFVAFSPFHFHRLFHGAVGESITDYIRKRRLAEAAAQLASTQQRIIDIALTYRFESQASFTKAFRRMYGVAPGAYRRKGAHVAMAENEKVALQHGIRQEPRIVELPERQIVGLLYVGKNLNGEIPAMWGRFRPNEVPNRVDSHLAIGYCESVANPTEEGEFGYVAGVYVSSTDQVPEGMVARTVPGGTYAVFTHEGPLAALGASYEYIWGTWMPGAAYTPVSAPDFELYDERFDPMAAESVLELYVPVKPRT